MWKFSNFKVNIIGFFSSLKYNFWLKVLYVLPKIGGRSNGSIVDKPASLIFVLIYRYSLFTNQHCGGNYNMYNVMRNKDIFFSSFLFALICTKKSKPAYISCIVMFFFKLFIVMETYTYYTYMLQKL